MHKHRSTSYEEKLRARFQSNPVGARVVLPDGSLAVVTRKLNSEQGTIYRVTGVDRSGKFRPLEGLPCWYTVDELRLPYTSVGIAPGWRA
jgi:hypothetical protein